LYQAEILDEGAHLLQGSQKRAEVEGSTSIVLNWASLNGLSSDT
jgi:hypothetical protein